MDKRKFIGNERIITAVKPEGKYLIDVKIFHLNKNYNLVKKIIAKKADVKNNDWILYDAQIFNLVNGIFEKTKI